VAYALEQAQQSFLLSLRKARFVAYALEQARHLSSVFARSPALMALSAGRRSNLGGSGGE
jgi:hypothetical protein